MITKFTICRRDGRSNQQVVIDLVKNAEPNTIFSYEEIAKSLMEGTDQVFDLARVRSIVYQCQYRLQKEHQRALKNLRGVGYSVAKACEHVELAHIRQTKADRQLHRGLHILKNTRLNELTETERNLALGMVTVMSAIVNQVSNLTRRMNRIEEALDLVRIGDQEFK